MSPPFLPSVLANPLVLAGIAVCLLALAVYLLVRGIFRWQDARDLRPNDPPPLLIPVQRRGTGAPPLFPMRMAHEGAVQAAANGGPSVDAPIDNGPALDHGSGPAPQFSPQGLSGLGLANGNGGSGSAVGGVERGGRIVTPNVTPRMPSSGAPAPAPAPTGAAAAAAAAPSKVVHTIPPMDGTLQFLPGRLEIVDGETPGRDIRFVRTWGEVPEITFGRVTGPPYRHVQLRSQTVSRQHARMQYTDGRWKLTNLSQTNPVVVNGETLDSAHGQRVLRDGDQIEMGEVVFRFRER